MDLIEWKDSYSVGVDRMDQQHKKLVGILNEMSTALSKGKGKEALYDILMGLIEYTKKHFNDEEELMAEAGYPDLEKHKKEHKYLTRKVVEFAKKYNAGESGLSIELLNFLRSWLIVHIQGKDADYGRFINSSD